MNEFLVALGLLGGLFLLVLVVTMAIFNSLVKLKNRFKNAYAQIDVQLKRRYDLIPNIVETARGYLKHERETLEAVIAARNQAIGANKEAAADPGNMGSIKKLLSAESLLGSTMGRLFAVMENYPELKADKTMQQVMEELSSTENRISFARQAYNDAVMIYNTGREVFPKNMIAGMFNFSPAVLWEIDNPQEREQIKVAFG